MKKLMLTVALGLVIASPAFGSPVSAGNASRGATVRECSVLAAPYREPTWNNFEIHQYRTCMAQHGQVE